MTETEAKLMAARAEREALRIQLDAERERSRGFEQQVHDLLDDMEPLAAERDSLKAQLAALATEHEAAAKAAEAKVARMADVLLGVLRLAECEEIRVQNRHGLVSKEAKRVHGIIADAFTALAEVQQ